jgi:putative peptidoglycan lipid II flippase
MLNRGFFSLQAPWVPTLVALANLVLNVVLYVALYRVGTWGIPLAISLANIAAVGLLVVLLRRRIGRIDLASTIRSFLQALLASVVLGGVAYGVWWGLDDLLGRSFPGQLASLGTAIVVGGAAYLLAARVLGIREMQALHSLRGRIAKA